MKDNYIFCLLEEKQKENTKSLMILSKKTRIINKYVDSYTIEYLFIVSFLSLTFINVYIVFEKK